MPGRCRASCSLVENGAETETFAISVAQGLGHHPRRLSCRYLYDARGSELFERITEQPEYYLTSAEAALLRAHADAIRALVGPATLVELGSGTSAKTRHLLDAWTSRDPASTYVAVDICAPVVRSSSEILRREYPRLDVRGIAGSYEQAMPWLRSLSPLVLAFLGSTIGNFDDDEMDEFLARVADNLEPGDHLLLGIDLVKDVATLEAAYDDAAGVTAAVHAQPVRAHEPRARHARSTSTRSSTSRTTTSARSASTSSRASRARCSVELPILGESFRIARGETDPDRDQPQVPPGARWRCAPPGTASRWVETFTDEASRFASLLLRREPGRRARRCARPLRGGARARGRTARARST